MRVMCAQHDGLAMALSSGGALEDMLATLAAYPDAITTMDKVRLPAVS